MIENTIEKARSSDASRLVLTGLAYTRNCDIAFLVASDTFRVHTCEVDPDACPCEPGTTKAERPGTYPNWERTIPKEHTRSATVNAKTLETAVKACLLVAKHNANRVRLSFGNDSLKVWATCEDHPRIEATVRLEDSQNCQVVSCGEASDFTIALNGRFLLDAISAWSLAPKHLKPNVQVCLKMTEPSRPVLIQTEDTVFRAVVMPMAID